MSDQFRDTCVNKQNKNRGTEDPIRVSFFDKDGDEVYDITRKEANCIASLNPSQLFYFIDGDGFSRQLSIAGVNALTVNNQLQSAPSCASNPQICGPPKVEFFGGNGLGAVANTIVSPNSSSIIGFDFKSRGFNYTDVPFAQIIDDCGVGSGAGLLVQMQSYGSSTRSRFSSTLGQVPSTTNLGISTTQLEELSSFPENPSDLNDLLNLNGLSDLNTLTNLTGLKNLSELSNLFGIFGNTQKFGQEIKNIVIKSPGNKYLSFPDGSLGGNGRVWKFPNEGYVITKDGKYYVVPEGQIPTDLPPGDTFVPPQPPSPEVLPPGLPQVLPPSLPPDVVTPTTVTLPPIIFVPTSPPTIPSIPTYPVVLDIEEVYIDDGGFGYQPGDTMTVVPDNGAIIEPIVNDRGEIEKINVINPGIGFVDIPEIFIDSETGYNAKLIPVLRSTPLSEIPDPTILPPETQLITVVDCVGKIAPKSEFDIIPR